MSATPAVSGRRLASGGMALKSRRDMRASISERSGSPGAMMRASGMPKSPSYGGTAQARMFASGVP